MPLYGMVQVDGMFGKKNDQVSIDFEEHCWDVPCHCMPGMVVLPYAGRWHVSKKK